MTSIPFLIFLLFAPPQQTNATRPGGQSADSLIKEGLAAYQSGKLEIAIGRMTEAHRIAPSNPYASLYLGLMLNQRDPDSRESRNLMESVLDKFETNQDLLLRLFDSYLRAGNTGKADSLLARMQKPMQGNPRLAFNLVYTMIRYGRLEGAKAELEKVSARVRGGAPDGSESSGKPPVDKALAAEISFIEGLIAATSNQSAEAMRLFQLADRSDFPPRDSIQMQMLAEALYSLDEYRLSIQAYRVYLDHFPHDTNARMHLGLAEYAYGLFDRAGPTFQKVLEEAPRTTEVHLYYGLSLLEKKNTDEARKQFQEELKINPQSYQAMSELAYLDYLSGDDENCRRWLEKAQPLNPDWFETNMVFGLLYNRQGQFDRAIKCLESVVRDKPQYYKAHFQLSLAYRRSGDEAKAAEHFGIYERLVAEEKKRQLEGVAK